MKPEHPSESLLERSLAAWDVPEPPPDLTDRILAHNADAVEALSQPPPESPFEEADETPAMLPTEPHSSPNLRARVRELLRSEVSVYRLVIGCRLQESSAQFPRVAFPSTRTQMHGRCWTYVQSTPETKSNSPLFELEGLH